MSTQRGWWKITFTTEPTQRDLEHIAGLIQEGYTEGEMVHEDQEVGTSSARPDGMSEDYADLAATSGWGPCSMCGLWGDLKTMVDDGSGEGTLCHKGCKP